MESLLISVVMPFYNVAPYFEEAIESVLGQTYKHWELLLADDGSTDGSTDIAKSYENEYPGKIKYLCHPKGSHLGTVASRMLAIRKAEGQYLALLDADDCWMPEKLAFQVKIIKKHPDIGMICGATKYWYSWADPQKNDLIIRVGGKQDVPIPSPEAALMLYPLGDGAAPCLCSIVLKKEAAMQYDQLAAHFSGKYQLYEDQAFLIKIYLSDTIFISSIALDLYRQRMDSNMHSLTEKGYYHEVRLYFLRWLQKYMAVNNLNMPSVQKKIRKAILQYKYPFWYKFKKKILKH